MMDKIDPRRFSHERYDKLCEDTFDNVRELSRLKGGEYSGDDDRLANFRRNGYDTDTNYETVWRVYAAKHWDAIGQYIRDKNNSINRVRMEGLSGRVDDLIVYLLLFKAMIAEAEDSKSTDQAAI